MIPPRLQSWLLISAAMVLVLWFRMLPFSLPAAENAAEDLVRLRLRERLAREVASTLPPSQWAAEINARIQTWIAQHPDRFAAGKAALVPRLRADWSYEGPDGTPFPYLGDVDSYTWVREARNYLRSGTTCDAVVNGECRDTYVMAPVGVRMIYPRSLHIAAIVGLHTSITFFVPHYPLPASAMLVPVIIGTLGVLPAFWIGRRLAGTFGGLTAAVISGLHPQLLLRSTGSDNDVWNVVLPLFMVWAAMAALDAVQMLRRIGSAIIAGVFAGLHAATWSGWHFMYNLVLCGLLGAVLLHSLRFFLRNRTTQVWQAHEVRATLSVCLVFYLAAGLSTMLVGAERSAFAAPFAAVQSLLSSSTAGNLQTISDRDLWPDILATVREGRTTDWLGVIQSIGDPLFFLGGLGGLLVMLLTLFRSLFLPSPSMEREKNGDTGATLIVILWFLATLYVAKGALRFLLFLGPPFAIVFAVAASRLSEWMRGWSQRMLPRSRCVPPALVWTFSVLVLFLPIQRGYATSNSYLPLINDAWWNTLTNLRDHAAPDAIINTAWDYGYWVKYVAERRTSADGASLRTHVPSWLDRAFATANERESVGLLRMLNCGSDATPFPEGKHGAYGKLRAKGLDVLTVPTTILTLAGLEKPEAAAYLAKLGLTMSEQEDILRSTHCTPPETYVILSSGQTRTAGHWLRIGLWDFSKAYIALQAGRLSQQEAVADFMNRFGYTASGAEALLSQARALNHDFIVPGATYSSPYVSPVWLPCLHRGDGAVLGCPVGLVNPKTGLILREFFYDRTLPQNSRLRFATAQTSDLTGPAEGAPGALIVAGTRGLMDVALPAPAYPEVGVLIDTLHNRILVGTPAYLRSTFVQLVYLDGRYATHFKKVDEREVLLGERVVTWRVPWEQ